MTLSVAAFCDGRARELAAQWLGDRATPEALARIAWSVLIEPGDSVAGELIARDSPLGALEHVARGGGGELGEAVARWAPRWQPALLHAALEQGIRRGIALVVPGDGSWPRGFDDLGPHAPVCLWVKGDPSALSDGVATSIVGARSATPYGEHVAGLISGDLVRHGVTIVSGAAYGIDGAAHRAALQLDGRTVAFVAGGVDRVYPAGHANLLQQIGATGAVVAECAPGTTPTRWRFLARNRLIAALGAATIVVEAGYRSGSINTAGHAASLGRALGAVPGPVTSSTSAGCHRLLRDYDAVCVTSADDVRELLGLGVDPVPLVYESAASVRLTDALSDRRALTVAELAQRSGLSRSDVQSALGLLHLSGTAAERPDGWILVR
ncbi:MAG TPA: DNA-processing protein DprA [Microbacterium sp.]|nr:DNA-processing protein DprA [Microbacterium sp.]